METEADVNPSGATPGNSSAGNSGNNAGSSNGNGTGAIRFNPNDLYYDMKGERHLVIFNHDEYDNMSLAYYGNPLEPRTGSRKDVAELETTFKELLGFTNIFVHHNYTREKIWSVLLEMRKKDYSAASCLCVVILTHGYRAGELCAYDKPFYLRDVMDLFVNHPTLAGKPKLFFVQACRGEKKDSGDRIAIDGHNRAFYTIPSHADFLLLRSTIEEYRSYRDYRGSWLMQELIKALRLYHQDLEFLQIITLVHRKIAFEYATTTPTKKSTNDKRQMPETTFTLTKFLKF